MFSLGIRRERRKKGKGGKGKRGEGEGSGIAKCRAKFVGGTKGAVINLTHGGPTRNPAFVAHVPQEDRGRESTELRKSLSKSC